MIRPVMLAIAVSIVLAHRSTAPCTSGQPLAFTNARLLTMDSPMIRAGRTVLVEGSRISAIDPDAIPANACRIDAAGGVLLPGLADVHVHTDERELPLFLANGVTLVREMNGSPPMVALRERINAGEKLGPRLLVASPLLVGTPLQYRHRLITSAADATAAAREAKAAGYEYLKIYDGLSREEYDAFVVAGRELGLPLDGHVPAKVGLARVVEVGQSIQHMDKIAFALGGHPGDTTKLPELQKLFGGKGLWVTPTLSSLRALDMSRTVDYATRMARPEIAYMDAGTIGWWQSLSGDRPSRARSAYYQFQVAVLKELRKTNTRFLLGTDAGNPLTVPGFSVHDELEALTHDGGFTPFEALRLATRNVGEFLGDTTIGRLAPGARADLVLVSGDPLMDLSILRRPVGVVVRGRWLDRATLDSLLASARPR
jgi:hypothetical protein